MKAIGIMLSMDFLWHWWDVIVFGLLMGVHILAWLEIKDGLSRKMKEDFESRELAATTLSNASTAGIIAVTVLIPASLLILQLGSDSKAPMPREALENVFKASSWFLISLLFGLFVIFIVPMRSQSRNVTGDLLTGIPFGPQLIALFVGMFRLVVGLYFAVYH